MLDQIASSTRSRLLRLVEELLAAEAGFHPTSLDDSLTELGMSSLGMVNLMLSVEAEFELTIPQSYITPDNFRSILSIETLVLRLTSDGTV